MRERRGGFINSMNIPVIRGLIDRRILVNYRVAPEVMRRALPPPFRPTLVNGRAMAGVCLIRLREIRPRFLPAVFGLSSENAAHRIAVEWPGGDGGVRQGVFVPRRDTSSRLNCLAGGRVFPGVHHHASFAVNEGDSRYSVRMESDDRSARLRIEARETDALPRDSVFATIEEASSFFERGSIGYSPGSAPGCFDGLELRSLAWSVRPLTVTRVESSYFECVKRFPPGTVRFDSALLMCGIPHEWHTRQTIQPAESSSGFAGESFGSFAGASFVSSPSKSMSAKCR